MPYVNRAHGTVVLTVGGLFDGIGLLAYGLHRAGLEHRWLCEADEFRRSILRKRWPGIPVYGDVRAVGSANAEPVTVIAGGFPCKGASTLGKRGGFDHPETVLWREMARAVGELRPRYVVVENVANILALDGGAIWGKVLADLAALGFDVVWDCVPAAAFGAPHLRDRVVAVATDSTIVAQRESTDQAHALAGGRQTREVPSGRGDRVAAHANGLAGRNKPLSERRSGGPSTARDAGQAPPDSGCGGREGLTAEHRSESEEPVPHARRLGVPVEWGEYGPAIRRWEAVVGAAPEPICAFRGVDARDAAGVERSRVSALGDGVQRHLGELVGRYVIGLEEERLAA